jgi:uncharacterized membrane protein
VVLLPFLPLVVFAIPDAMTFMPEPRDPWYTQYTTPVWFVCFMYVYPVTGFLRIFGIKPFSVIHILGMILYAGAIAALLYRLLFGKPPSQPEPSGLSAP